MTPLRVRVLFDCLSRKHQKRFLISLCSSSSPTLFLACVQILTSASSRDGRLLVFYLRDVNSLRMWRGQAKGPGDRVSHSPETLQEKDPCDFPPSPKTRPDNEEEILFSTGLRGRSNVKLPGVFPRQRRWEVVELRATQSAWLSYCVKFTSCVLCMLPTEELTSLSHLSLLLMNYLYQMKAVEKYWHSIR